MMPKLTEIEALYYRFLNSGELFKLDSSFTGYISEDWDKFLTYYKKSNQ